MLLIRLFVLVMILFFFFSSRRRHTRFDCDWSSDVCSSDLTPTDGMQQPRSTLREPGLGLYLLVMNNRDKLDKVREWLQTAGLVAIPFEIGRASCRERV